MTRPLTLIALLADALLCVALGLGVPLLIGIAGWLATTGWNDTPFSVLVAAASALWALGLGGGVGLTISPQAFPELELAEPFAFVVSVAPLTFAALIVTFAWRSGARLSADNDLDFPWLDVLASVVSFAAAAVLSLQFAPDSYLRIDTVGAVVTGTLLWTAAFLIGLRVWEYVPWSDLLGDRVDTVMALTTQSVKLASGLVVGMFGLASLAMLVALLTGVGRAIALMQVLQLDVWGAIALGLVQLAYVPTLLVWAMSWLFGPGFALGEGSYANLGGTVAGPLPAAPILGLVPETIGMFMWALIALPLILAIAIALATRIQDPDADKRPLLQRIVVPLAGSLGAALVLALLAHLSRGSLGPGRLLDFGPHPGWMLVASFGVFVVGTLAATLIPVNALVPGLVDEPEVAAEAADRQRAEATEPAAATADRNWLWKRNAASGEELTSVETQHRGGVRAGDTAQPAAADDEFDFEEPSDWPPSATSEPDASVTAEAEPTESAPIKPTPSKPESRDTAADEADAPPERGWGRRHEPKSQPDLSEVLRRPGEPDIYADLDDDLYHD